ncbi:ribosylnicotinamide kinase [Podila epicladia]|nr:ribosylnicotinamide kinase [Podila epicladia]KAG0094502.1 ribosylnicotinamide kinase [Podila epicladia]
METTSTSSTRQTKIISIGLSGPTSGGKTTVSRYLKSILPNSTLLHQDDFYFPEDQLPIDPKTGLANWDCPQAIDFAAMIKTLTYIRDHNEFPDGFDSLEDKNPIGSKELSTPVPQAVLDSYREQIMTQVPSDKDIKFVIVDGFMLYVNEHLCDTIDIKLYLTAPYKVLKDRRESRKGYATLEGYWEDPPGYFDDVVWPNYLNWNGPFVELTDAMERGEDSGEYGPPGTRGTMTKNVDVVSSGNATIQSMVERVSGLITKRAKEMFQ